MAQNNNETPRTPEPDWEAAKSVPATPSRGIDLSKLPHHSPELLTAVDEVADNDEEVIKSLHSALTRRRTEPGTDAFTIHPEMRAKYGIGDKETLAWKLNPHINPWDRLHGNQNLDHWLSTVPGSRVVTYQEDGETNYVRAGDFILCAYDSRLDEAHRRIKQAQQEEFLHNTHEGDMVIPDEHHGDFTIPRFRNTDGEIKAMHTNALRELKNSGMIGEWAGQDMDTVLSALGEAAVDEICARHRGGYTSESEGRQETTERERRAGGSGKVISIPQNVRPRNFAGARK